MPSIVGTNAGGASPKQLAAILKKVAKWEGKGKKAKKPRKGRKAKKIHPKHWHNNPVSATAHASTAGDPWKSAHAHATGELPMVVLSADAALGSTMLDLAGEGKIGLATALAGWQREQERLTNRVWRRPGGLQKMGGL